MAVSYKGLTIKFGGDTTGLQGALKKIQSESRKTNADLKEINKSLKFNPGNTELLAQKVRTLNSAYEETKQRLDAYKQAMEQLEAKKQRGEELTSEEQRQYDSLQRSILQCENQLDSYADELKSTATEMEASKTALYQLGQTLEDNADKFEAAGKAMETVGTAMVGTATAVTGATLAAFNEVDGGLDAVIKTTGATGEAADELGERVKAVATTVAGSSYDWETLGNTVGELSVRFGLTGQDLDDCSERFLQFATITGTDATTAVRLVSRAMGDAGIDASEYGDVLDALAAASQNSGIEVDKLAGLLTSYGAPMRALGFDTQEAIAIFSQWELAGVNTETAFSGMKKAISNWSAEGKDARVEFSKTLEEIANCPDIASATTKAIEVFGAKAGPDLADAIQGGRFAYEDFLAILDGSQGTVSSTFDATVDGVDQIAVAEKELQVAGAELGAAFSDVLGPIMQDLASILHDMADAFAAMTPEQKEFIAKAVLAAGAAGTLAIGFGKVFQAAGQIGAGLKTLSTIMPAVKAAWGAVTAFISANPIGLGIAAVAAAVAGLTWFFTQTETGKQMWADFTAWITEKWEALQEFLAGIPDWWGGVTDGIASWNENLKANLEATWENVKSKASEKWENIKTGAIEKWESLKTSVTDKVNGMKDAISSGFTSAKDTVTQIVEDIKTSITDKLNAAKDAVADVIDRIKEKFDFTWSLPSLALPHPTISGHFSLNPPSVPSFGIEWYANGGAIEPNNPRLIGVGDASEREWLEPESKLLSIIQAAMRSVSVASGGVSVEVNVSATVTGQQSAYELGQNIGRGISSVMKQRGHSYA